MSPVTASRRLVNPPARRSSSQGFRLLGREFVVQFANGLIPGAPVAALIPCPKREAVLCYGGGVSVAVRSLWVRARLADWLDREIAGGRELYFGGARRGDEQRVGREVLDRIIDWIVLDAWADEPLGAGTGECRE